jgi:hypothetical protein
MERLGRRIYYLIGASVLGVLIVGIVLAGAVFAQGGQAQPQAVFAQGGQAQPQNGKAVYQNFVTKLANNLGIADASKVDMAVKTTFNQLVDERQAAGNLTQEQATKLKQAINSPDFPQSLRGVGIWGHPGFFMHGHSWWHGTTQQASPNLSVS